MWSTGRRASQCVVDPKVYLIQSDSFCLSNSFFCLVGHRINLNRILIIFSSLYGRFCVVRLQLSKDNRLSKAITGQHVCWGVGMDKLRSFLLECKICIKRSCLTETSLKRKQCDSGSSPSWSVEKKTFRQHLRRFLLSKTPYLVWLVLTLKLEILLLSRDTVGSNKSLRGISWVLLCFSSISWSNTGCIFLLPDDLTRAMR